MLTLSLLALSPLPIDLDGISPDRARSLAARVVVASLVASEPYTLRGTTVVGSVSSTDEVIRGAVMAGRQFDVTVGKRLRVVGVLRVIDNPASVVNGRVVAGWLEVRVDASR